MARGTVAIFTLLLSVFLVGCRPESPRAPDPAGKAEAPAGNRIEAIGRLEPAGGIYQISGLTGDRLAKLMVSAGDQVAAGQVLAELDSYQVRKAQLDAAEAQLAEAEKQLGGELNYAETMISEAQLGVEQAANIELDIQVQEAQLRVYEATLELARADLERLQGLDPQLTSPQQLEAQQLAVHQAEEQLTAGRWTLRKLQSTEALSRQQAAAAVATAQAARQRVESSGRTESLRAAVRLAQAQLESSIIRAPLAGTVLQVLTRPGETLGRAPILTLADTTNMVAIAEVYETDVQKVAVGQVARIDSPALAATSDGLSGHVVEVGRSVAQNQLFELDPTRMRADARVVEVRIALDDASLAEQYLNLQVDVTIFLDRPTAEPMPEPTTTATEPVAEETAQNNP